MNKIAAQSRVTTADQQYRFRQTHQNHLRISDPPPQQEYLRMHLAPKMRG